MGEVTSWDKVGALDIEEVIRTLQHLGTNQREGQTKGSGLVARRAPGLSGSHFSGILNFPERSGKPKGGSGSAEESKQVTEFSS